MGSKDGDNDAWLVALPDGTQKMVSGKKEADAEIKKAGGGAKAFIAKGTGGKKK